MRVHAGFECVNSRRNLIHGRTKGQVKGKHAAGDYQTRPEESVHGASPIIFARKAPNLATGSLA
jgi:hypothetical protein